MVRILERALNSAQVSRKGLSTSPHARKSQVVGSNSGTEPECRTGHFKVSDCPGGSLPSSFIWRSRCLRSSITGLQGGMIRLMPGEIPISIGDPSHQNRMPAYIAKKSALICVHLRHFFLADHGCKQVRVY